MDVPELDGFGTAEGRWARLGPYYAMFPINFARQVVQSLSRQGDTVLDPFCGRGTAPYVAMIAGRHAIGCDVNPVAWVYAAAKTEPHPDPGMVIRRMSEIESAVRPADRKPVNEFQAHAFAPRPLGFINAARRELQWRDDSRDRTVAAFLLHYLHAKTGEGLSNQMRASRALSPDYAIRWWHARGLATPPDIAPLEFLSTRAMWRYAKGLPRHAGCADILLGDSALALPKGRKADLILTSPPYSGVTNYRADSWLRLWALGEGAELPDWGGEQKFCDVRKYTAMLRQTLQATRARSTPDAVWYIRTDARSRTKDAVRQVMADLLPHHQCYSKAAPYPGKTQTALYGDHAPKPGEVDLLYLPCAQPRRKPAGFRKCPTATR